MRTSKLDGPHLAMRRLSNAPLQVAQTILVALMGDREALSLLAHGHLQTNRTNGGQAPNQVLQNRDLALSVTRLALLHKPSQLRRWRPSSEDQNDSYVFLTWNATVVRCKITSRAGGLTNIPAIRDTACSHQATVLKNAGQSEWLTFITCVQKY